MNTKETGNIGEQKAVQYLLKNEFKIIFKNFRKHGFEIDIVALDKNDVLRFIEVKAVVDGSLEDAAFSIENRNIYRYINGVDAFLVEYPLYRDRSMAMDAVIVQDDLITYYENITGGLLIT